MVTFKTGPILPLIFDGMIQTTAAIWAEGISEAFSVVRILALIHGWAPLVIVMISKKYKQISLQIRLILKQLMPQCGM